MSWGGYYSVRGECFVLLTLSGFWFLDVLTLCCLWSLSAPDPFEPFLIFSIRHEIRRIDLKTGDYSLLVPALRNTIALDFHFSQRLLYWTDVVEDQIYRGKISDSGGKKNNKTNKTIKHVLNLRIQISVQWGFNFEITHTHSGTQSSDMTRTWI